MSFTLARHEVGSVEAFMGPALRFSPAAQTQGSPSGSHFVFLNLGNNNNNITLCSISYVPGALLQAILYIGKLYFKNKGEMKTFKDEEKDVLLADLPY